MIYNLQDEYARKKFAARVKYLWEKHALVELTDASRRTSSQNAFLHVCIGIVAMETGNSSEVIKTEIYKKRVNPDLFVRRKADPTLGEIEVLRSSRDLSKEEMSLSIDRFRMFASEHGIYIPNPEDAAFIAQAEMEIANSQKYL